MNTGLATDDTATPEHQAAVRALSERERACRAFRIGFDCDLLSGLGASFAGGMAADILGQMVAELTSRIRDPAVADRLRRQLVELAATSSADYDRQSRSDPSAWAKRRGGPGLPSSPVLPRRGVSGHIGSEEPEVLSREAAAIAEGMRALAQAMIRQARNEHRHLDSAAAAALFRGAVIDEAKRQAELGSGAST